MNPEPSKRVCKNSQDFVPTREYERVPPTLQLRENDGIIAERR